MVRYGMEVHADTADNLRHMQELLNQWLRQGEAPPQLRPHVRRMRHMAQELIRLEPDQALLYDDLFHMTLELGQILSMTRAAAAHQQQLVEIWTEPDVCDRVTTQTQLFNTRLESLLAAAALSRETARCAVALARAVAYSFTGEVPMDLRPGLGHHPPSLHALHRATKELLRSFVRLCGDLDRWRQDFDLHAARLQATQPTTLAPRPVPDACRPAQPLLAQTSEHMQYIAVCYDDQMAMSAQALTTIDELTRYLTQCVKKVQESWCDAGGEDAKPL
jgi:hypothetical protein